MLRHEYYIYLLSMIATKFVRQYSTLLEYLYATEFNPGPYPLDESRYGDGIGLRYSFGVEKGYPQAQVSAELDDIPCSMLEMMIALSRRCENQFMIDMYDDTKRIYRWFWSMITSLGLQPYNNDNFDRAAVEEIIFRFNTKQYEPNGSGGLYTVKSSEIDMRTLDIWSQMMVYLREQYTKGL